MVDRYGVFPNPISIFMEIHQSIDHYLLELLNPQQALAIILIKPVFNFTGK